MIRDYLPSDASMVAGWAEAHGVPPPPAAMLPEVGVVCTRGQDPVAAAWLYRDDSSGVGFPHWLVTAPGLTLSDTRQAVAEIVSAFENVAKKHNIHTLVVTVHAEAIAREAINNHGFLFLGQGATLYRPCHSSESVGLP